MQSTLQEFLLVFAILASDVLVTHTRAAELEFLEQRPTRIVGGDDAQENAHPWQVSLQWGNRERNVKPRHVCGGALLASGWVLTAGHCKTLSPKRPGGYYLVLAGKHMLGVKEETEQVREVADAYVHPDYDGSVAPYDIALLKLEEPFDLTEAVATVALPAPEQDHHGTAMLTGWGSVSRTRVPERPEVLQAAMLPILEYPECKVALDKVLKRKGRNPLHPSNICTGPLDGTASACKGDSGGPLVVTNSLDMVEVIGVVSWGLFPCGKRNAPSVYTRVSYFVPWIKETMGED